MNELTNQDSPWFARLLDRYGAPTVMLVCMTLGVFKIASWIAPKLDTFLAAHIEQISTLSTTQERQTEIMRDTNRILEAIRLQGSTSNQLLEENQDLIEKVIHEKE